MNTCFVSVVALLVTMAQTFTFEPTTLIVKSNFEFGLVRKEFRVQYGGVVGCNEEEANHVSILIYKGQDNVIEFSVPKDDVATRKAYYFAKKDAQPGQYWVVVSQAGNYSNGSMALTKLLSDTEKPKLKCKSMEIPFPSVTKFMSKEDAAKTPGSMMKAFGFTDNPQFKNSMLYAAVEYPIYDMKDLYHSPSLDNSTIDCQRKYLFFTNLHLVNRETKEVKYRMRYYLAPMSNYEVKKYVLDETNTRPSYLPIENVVDHEDKIADGTYDLWVSFCSTEKARLDSTFCSEPLIKENFIVADLPQA